MASRIATPAKRESVQIPDRPHISDKRRLAIYLRDGGRCQACNAKVGKGEYHIDHDEQRWLAGDDSDENLRVLCIPCHKPKTAKDASERAKVRGMSKLSLDAPSTRSAAWGSKTRPMQRPPRVAKRGRNV